MTSGELTHRRAFKVPSCEVPADRSGAESGYLQYQATRYDTDPMTLCFMGAGGRMLDCPRASGASRTPSSYVERGMRTISRSGARGRRRTETAHNKPPWEGAAQTSRGRDTKRRRHRPARSRVSHTSDHFGNVQAKTQREKNISVVTRRAKASNGHGITRRGPF